MSRHQRYTQCRLRRPLRADRQREPGARLERGLRGSEVFEVMESWIPADIAKKDATVRLKEVGPDRWSEGWVVTEVWGTVAGQQAEAAVPDWKHQRRQSDV